MVLDIDLIKLHLHIDNDDEDLLLEHYLKASIQQCELITHRTLVGTNEDAIAQTDDDVPNDIKEFLLLTIGDMYKNRENGQEGKLTTYFDHLLDGYIRYDI